MLDYFISDIAQIKSYWSLVNLSLYSVVMEFTSAIMTSTSFEMDIMRIFGGGSVGNKLEWMRRRPAISWKNVGSPDNKYDVTLQQED